MIPVGKNTTTVAYCIKFIQNLKFTKNYVGLNKFKIS